MRSARGSAVLVLGGAALLLLSACSSGTDAGGGSSPSSMASMTPGMSMSPGASMSPGMNMSGMGGPITGKAGSLIVVAPGTLANALPSLDSEFTGAHGGAISPNIGHSPAQVVELEQGSPGDVFLTIGAQSMDQAQKADLLATTPMVIARAKLAIVVAPGNPKHITSLADLAEPGVTVVLPDTSTPVGVYADEALRKAGVTVKPASTEEGSPEAAEAVATGNADASIVLVTDVLAQGTKVDSVAVPQADQVPAKYYAAVLKSTTASSTAKAFVMFLASATAQHELHSLGFLAP